MNGDYGAGMAAFRDVGNWLELMAATIGAITVAIVMFRIARWFWRTRKDKGYNANKWGAF
jgi:hypothetical protein